MIVSGLTIVVANSVVAAVLLVAALTKMLFPQPLQRALGELGIKRPGLISAGTVRVLAGVEIAAGLGLLFPFSTAAAAVAVSALGAAFAMAGVAGRLRRSAVPCGCIGDGKRPLGSQNVVIGAAIAGIAAVNFLTPPAAAADQLRMAPITTAVAMVVLSFWLHRDLAWPLLRARPLPIAK